MAKLEYSPSILLMESGSRNIAVKTNNNIVASQIGDLRNSIFLNSETIIRRNIIKDIYRGYKHRLLPNNEDDDDWNEDDVSFMDVYILPKSDNFISISSIDEKTQTYYYEKQPEAKYLVIRKSGIFAIDVYKLSRDMIPEFYYRIDMKDAELSSIYTASDRYIVQYVYNLKIIVYDVKKQTEKTMLVKRPKNVLVAGVNYLFIFYENLIERRNIKNFKLIESYPLVPGNLLGSYNIVNEKNKIRIYYLTSRSKLHLYDSSKNKDYIIDYNHVDNKFYSGKEISRYKLKILGYLGNYHILILLNDSKAYILDLRDLNDIKFKELEHNSLDNEHVPILISKDLVILFEKLFSLKDMSFLPLNKYYKAIGVIPFIDKNHIKDIKKIIDSNISMLSKNIKDIIGRFV